MGRAPCCDKANVKKGPWSPEEDAKLKSYIDQHGTGGNWIALPQKIGLKRCGKSCRLRWLNYLRPNIKHGGFSEEEDNIICSLYISIGSRWSIIAAQLPGRTDNDIKNYWNTRLKKKLLGKQRKGKQTQKGRESAAARGKTSNSGANANNVIPNSRIFGHGQQQPPSVTVAYGSCLQPQLLPVLPPVPYSCEEPRSNDYASIRRLLIKLGGRFSDQIDGEQFKLDHQYTSMNDPSILIPNDHYGNNSLDLVCNSDQIPLSNMASAVPPNGADFGIVLPWGGDVDLSNEAMERLLYENSHALKIQQQGLEFSYADDIVNGSAGNATGSVITGSGANVDWGEMTSLVFAALSSSRSQINEEVFLQGSTTDMAATASLEEVVGEKTMRYPSVNQCNDGL